MSQLNEAAALPRLPTPAIYSTATKTSDALMIAVAAMPTLRPRLSTESFVIEDVTMTPSPISI